MNILFVCTGNTCRSPMAEAILKNMNLPGVEVKSAGVYAMEGQEASYQAKLVMDEHSIKHNHFSRQINEQDLKWATYILTMTESHKSALLINYPDAAGKTFTLKEFAGKDKKGSDIVDPFGGSADIYRETFSELQAVIKSIVHRLQK
ncbi:protein-tyrosine phosphatase [Peribacillus deserti]|uniref:Protein-tyrosine phosphatase n=1 Tax=Peribacillus deserti TaxID=673318 RepID=A0ABS2QC54_9BACI|nr:low molecular weight protein arginine phosphatase [Peribacillus deserti]MBM7690672.1 protein-tyrosine phosphatase [Peribacillus deserti]